MSGFKHHAQSEALGNALRELANKQEQVITLEEQIKSKYLVPKGVKLLMPLLEDWSCEELDRLIKACEKVKQEKEEHNSAVAKQYRAQQELTEQLRACISLGSSVDTLAAALRITKKAAKQLITKLA